MENFINAKFVTTTDPEYYQTFWQSMKGIQVQDVYLESGKKANNTHALPSVSIPRFHEARLKESLFRNIASVAAVSKGSTVFAEDFHGSAEWIPENSSIDLHDGDEDFDRIPLGYHKLGSILRFPEDFVHDATFNIERYILKHFAKAVSRCEDSAFITGDGVNEPFGILHPQRGAEIGVNAKELTYDAVIQLFFSVKPEYRKHGKWLMNDDTALILRTLKDADGNYLWNQANDTILGKEVLISEFMPSDGMPVAFGDFEYYQIIDRSEFSCRVLRETYVDDAQVGYLGYEFVDGLLLRREAVKTLCISE
ncbi:MAG: phage major capsid protein [Clostridia bacterium]|nr:phage major capsid protein [Clostridia bacterium]